MAAQYYKINYKSDFVLTINSDAGWAVPFCIKFWTGMPSHGYFAGFDGENYVNCRVGETPTQLLVMFDDHHMPIGPLRMQIAYHTTIEEFPDCKFDEVTNPTNVTVDIDGTEYQVMLDFTGETGAEIDFSMPSSGVMSVNGKIGYVTLNAEDVGAQPTIEDLATIRNGAAEGATAVQPAELQQGLATKQDTINDLATIRSGAAAGATAVQPATLQEGLATKQNVISDLATIRSGAAAGATAYQKPNTGIPKTDLASGVQSSLDKADAAAPQSSTYTKGEVDTLIEGAISDIDVDDALSTTSENPVQNKVVTTALNGKQTTISDLSTIRSGAAAGATAVQPAALTPIESDIDAIEGKIPSAASTSNQLADKAFVNSALADKADAADIPTALSQLSQDSTHRVVTDSEKSTWNGKQNAIDDLATIRSGAAAGATAVQPAAMNTALAAKQDTLTFDNTPTANSNNPVKSSGIKTALDAKQTTISTVNVTVDNNTGTPSGSASVSGSTLSLSFQNLKGATGATGATGPQGPQGERGLPGESGVTGDVSGFTVIQTIDPSATYGATDIAGAATVQATNAELTELAGEVADMPDCMYFKSVSGEAKWELYASGSLMSSTGVISSYSGYDLYKLSNFSCNQAIEISLYIKGSGFPMACVFDKNDTLLGAENVISTTNGYKTTTIDLTKNEYATAEYIIWNTYQYTTHNAADISSIKTIVERYPDYTEILGNELFSQQGIPDTLYFSKIAGAAKWELYMDGKFIAKEGTISSANNYNIYKLSNFTAGQTITLSIYIAGSGIPMACVFDKNDNLLGYENIITSNGYKETSVNLSKAAYATASYILWNTYQYSTHTTVDISGIYGLTVRHPEYVQLLKDEISEEIEGSKNISVLFIGNSLTQDAVSTLPLLLKEIEPSINFRLYVWYNAGSKLSDNYNRMTSNTACEIFSKCENTSSWVNYNSTYTMSQILSEFTFDVVCLQEYSYYNFTESELTTNYNNIVSYIQSNYTKPLKFVCLVDQPNRSKVETMITLAKSYAQTFVKTTVCEDIIPAGLATYYALSTDLDSLGDNGHLSPDGTHSQEGLPCLLQAYTLAMWVFEKIGIAKSIVNSQTRITTAIYNSLNVPGPNLGTGVVTGTDAQHVIAQQCAVKAYKYGKKLLNGAIDTLT